MVGLWVVGDVGRVGLGRCRGGLVVGKVWCGGGAGLRWVVVGCGGVVVGLVWVVEAGCGGVVVGCCGAGRVVGWLWGWGAV